MPSVADKWRDIGVHLLHPTLISNRVLEVIAADHPHSVEGCCKGVFEKWLDTQKDASWNQLVEAIKAIKLPFFASTLEKGVIRKLHVFGSALEKDVLGKGVTCIFKPGTCLVFLKLLLSMTCVCLPLRLLITSGIMLHDMDSI